MAQDLYIDSVTNDWFLEGGTTLRLCSTFEELIRQRLYIKLLTVKGEWEFDKLLGVPYFTSVYGKSNKNAVDAIFTREIRNTEGVLSIVNFESNIDLNSRKYSLTFSVETEKGVITGIEVNT